MGRHAKTKTSLWVRSLPVVSVAFAVALICGLTAGFVLLDKTPDDAAAGLNDNGPKSSTGLESTKDTGPPAADTSSSPSRKARPKRTKSSDPTSSSPATPDETPSQNSPQPSTPNTPRNSGSPSNSPSLPTTSPTPSVPAGVQGQLLRLVNQARDDAGCDPVTIDSRLTRAAQLHAEDMQENNYFSHSSQDGRTFVDRAQDQGYGSPSAENIAQGQPTASAVFNAWMNSSGHRANIESCSTRTMGVGHTQRDHYWVQDFGF